MFRPDIQSRRNTIPEILKRAWRFHKKRYGNAGITSIGSLENLEHITPYDALVITRISIYQNSCSTNSRNRALQLRQFTDTGACFNIADSGNNAVCNGKCHQRPVNQIQNQRPIPHYILMPICLSRMDSCVCQPPANIKQRSSEPQTFSCCGHKINRTQELHYRHNFRMQYRGAISSAHHHIARQRLQVTAGRPHLLPFRNRANQIINRPGSVRLRFIYEA